MRAVLSVLLVAAAVCSLAVAGDVGTIISITAMDDPPVNYLMLFSADNATAPIMQVNYPYYEFTTAGAIDLVRGRYLVMWESQQIGYYNLSTLQQINILDLPVQQIPDAMHYDAANDLIWLINVGPSQTQICKVTATGTMTCVGNVNGQYSYTADASAYDPVNQVLYVQLFGDGDSQPLFVFDINSNTMSAPIPMIDLCQSMNVATFNGVATLTCVDFITNIVVKVDPTTGKFTPLFDLTNAPEPYTTIIDNSGSSPVFYAELTGIIANHWSSFDMSTGKNIHNSTVWKNLQLSLPMYIPPGAEQNWL